MTCVSDTLQTERHRDRCRCLSWAVSAGLLKGEFAILFARIYGKNLQDAVPQGSRRPTVFIVFGNQRTGSTLIASKLNSHPRIICYEEIFLPWADSDPSLRDWLGARGRPQWLRAVPGVWTSFLASLFDMNRFPREVDAIGFELMYNQMSLWPRFASLVPAAVKLLRDLSLRKWLSGKPGGRRSDSAPKPPQGIGLTGVGYKNRAVPQQRPCSGRSECGYSPARA